MAVVAARARPPRLSAISGSPRVRVAPFTTKGTAGSWTVRWRIANDGDRPIRIVNAIQPHSQFRTPEKRVDRDVGPGLATDVSIPVRFDQPPGAVVENAFLIVVLRSESEWRLLARVRVTAGKNGEPLAGDSVVVTTQEIGAPD